MKKEIHVGLHCTKRERRAIEWKEREREEGETQRDTERPREGERERGSDGETKREERVTVGDTDKRGT